MLNNKEYFKQYYQKNREKILFRVKSNYAKSKFIKQQPVEEKTDDKKTIVSKGPIIITFD